MASDYVVKEKDGMYYVYNEVYEESLGKIIVASLVGLLIPEASDYYLPICIKMKKTYRIIKSIIFMLGLLIDVFFIYLFLKLGFNVAMGLCAVGMLFLTIGAIMKLEWNNRKRMKYEMIAICEKKEEP